MGSFIKHITGNDERIIILSRLHWIIAASGIFGCLALVMIGAGFDYVLREYIGTTVPFAGMTLFGYTVQPNDPIMTLFFGIAGLVILLASWIKMLATEIALTNHRVIYKTGLILVEVEEIDLVEIRAEHVNHGFFGRFLGYGRLHLDSRFVGDIYLPAVRNPYRLIKALHSARTRVKDPLGGNL